MAYKHTNFELLDNSGAEYCLCVQIYKKENKVFFGKIFRGIVKKIRPKDAHNPKVQKGEKLSLINVRTNSKFCKKGISVKFYDNSAIIINKKGVKHRVRGILPLDSTKSLPFKPLKRNVAI